MYAVELNNLSKHYSRGKIKAVDNVSLKVQKGQIFSLLGPNGSGKTTLMKVLLGLVLPTNGTATLLGESIESVRAHTAIGYLSENHHFPDFLTAEQILTYFGRMHSLDGATLKQRISELLRMVNLWEWKNVKLKNYSKGMSQRLGLAHA
ncbi:MAG: ATP-binding cassette domain-containing protein, partial [Caldithrix sp.]|nr:ATP-binding cassette domain-containing protein [Caldithrix sp.]